MIQKVSNQNNANLENEQSFERSSMNKSAMSSFEVVLQKQAQSMISKGKTTAEIAKAFNLPEDVIKNLVGNTKVASNEAETKVACSCENESDEAAKQEHLDNATKAFNELHGKKTLASDNVDTRTGKSVHSARGSYSTNEGAITDIGGPKKQIKTVTSNSIWDTEVLDRQMKATGNDERIKAEKAESAKRKAELLAASRYQTIDGTSLADAIKSTEQKKAANVQNMSVNEAHKYSKKVPTKGMSIFDSGKFDTIPEKTAGETIAEQKKQAASAKKDRSWINNTGSLTSKKVFDKMIDSLTNKKEK